jgi:hypothetical protein
MPTQQEPWFVIDRSEALAGLLLTSRADVRVRTDHKTDEGVDFLVELDPGARLSSKLLLVHIQGTATRDMREWLSSIAPYLHRTDEANVLPTCRFVVNVRDNQAFYLWVAEPVVEDGRAELRRLPSSTFRQLDESALDEIVRQVRMWYGTVPTQLSAQQR